MPFLPSEGYQILVYFRAILFNPLPKNLFTVPNDDVGMVMQGSAELRSKNSNRVQKITEKHTLSLPLVPSSFIAFRFPQVPSSFPLVDHRTLFSFIKSLSLAL